MKGLVRNQIEERNFGILDHMCFQLLYKAFNTDTIERILLPSFVLQ